MADNSKNKYSNLLYLLDLFDSNEGLFLMEPNSFKDQVNNFMANRKSPSIAPNQSGQLSSQPQTSPQVESHTEVVGQSAEPAEQGEQEQIQSQKPISINNDAFSDTTDFKTIQHGIKKFINALCSGLGNDVSLDVILNKVQEHFDNANKRTYDFDNEFLDRIPPGIMTQEKVLILLLYFLHNTDFKSSEQNQ